MDRVLLRVNRYCQFFNECAIASLSSIANYTDRNIDYNYVRSLVPAKKRPQGMFSPDQGLLLNKMGFSATIVTADQMVFDFSWSKLSKKGLIQKLKEKRKYYKSKPGPDNKVKRQCVERYIEWLESDYDNRIIIDWDFPKYIKSNLQNKIPVGASINFTSLFRFKKEPVKGSHGDIYGDEQEHAIVLKGYNDSHVFVVDSEGYMGYRRQGHYKLSWESLLINIPNGDLIWINE